MEDKKRELWLSASRIKTAISCSFLYWCQYHLKVPQQTNSGSQRGLVCHLFFELLWNPRHKHHFNKILKDKTIVKSPSVVRFIKKRMQIEGLNRFDNKGEDNFVLIDEMILVGLSYDFFCEGHELEEAEKEIKIENPKYKLKGFLDRISRKNDKLHLRDFKSSSKNTEDHSIQALSYVLWAKRVRNMDALIEFIYLRFPNDMIRKYEFSDKVLDGFERYLEYIYDYLKNFDESDANSNFAYDMGYPKDKSFSGIVSCGYGKHPGHANKEGKEYWNCYAKWPLDYWVVLDDNNQIKRSAFTLEELKLKDGEKSEFRHFSGCPRWNR